jgi:hypothetical protein
VAWFPKRPHGLFINLPVWGLIYCPGFWNGLPGGPLLVVGCTGMFLGSSGLVPACVPEGTLIQKPLRPGQGP